MRFGDQVAVDDISLSIDPGVVLGLIGPSGCGKTSLVRMLIGVLAPSEGEVTVFGRSPTDLDVGTRLRYGYMPQQPVLDEMRSEAPSGVDAPRVERLGELADTVTSSLDQVPDVTDWYAPAAVVLMLQQFGVAFGSLTFVRERQLGIVDVFRVAPVGATEALLGKYLAYLALGLAVGSALTALVVFAIGTPLAGGIWAVAAILALTLVASIGLGFVISLASGSDAQAVQYTMITLLASLFFSGFFLAVGQMEGVAKVIGWLLPVTFGMAMLRDVMLRGSGLDVRLVGGLAAYSVVAFVLALLGARRRIGTG